MNEKVSETLFETIRKGLIGEMRDLLAAGADPNYSTPYDTCMTKAARYGRLDVCRELIKAGADPTRKTTFDVTPLMEAARHGHVRVVKELTRLPIIDAAMKGEALWLSVGVADSVKALIEEGADVNHLKATIDLHTSSVGKGSSPLSRAIFLEASESVRLLLDAGADPNAIDVMGRASLHVITKDMPINMEQIEDESSGCHRILNMLLEAGADPNQKDGKGVTPMMWALIEMKPEMLPSMQRAGGDINVRHPKTGERLIELCERDFSEFARRLRLYELARVERDEFSECSPEGVANKRNKRL